MAFSPLHVPVLLNQIVEAFESCHLKVFLDGTIGAGGHARVLLAAHPEIDLYVGLDQDPQALALAAQHLEPWKNKVVLGHRNFEHFDHILSKLGVEKVDGILVDIGVSSMQLDQAERGFSFMLEGPLDMRMDPHSPLTAADVVNTYSEQELGHIFREFGEEKQWRAAAHAIVKGRQQNPIVTTLDLVHLLKPVLFWKHQKSIHPLTLIFQALRIYVNRELEVLKVFLSKAIHHLNPKGRLAVISFHSLEDRIVKEEFRFAASDKWDTVGIGGLFQDKEPSVSLVTRRPIGPTEEEVERNPRSRSAKLRVVEKR